MLNAELKADATETSIDFYERSFERGKWGKNFLFQNSFFVLL